MGLWIARITFSKNPMRVYDRLLPFTHEEIKKRQQALRLPTLEPPRKQGMLPPPEDEPPVTRRQRN
jgi:hypothetical protein